MLTGRVTVFRSAQGWAVLKGLVIDCKFMESEAQMSQQRCSSLSSSQNEN